MSASEGGHVHTPRDGRGARRVFVNGQEVQRVVYANTKSGLVRYQPEPFRVMRSRKHRNEIYERTLRGTVTVEPMP